MNEQGGMNEGQWKNEGNDQIFKMQCDGWVDEQKHHISCSDRHQML